MKKQEPIVVTIDRRPKRQASRPFVVTIKWPDGKTREMKNPFPDKSHARFSAICHLKATADGNKSIHDIGNDISIEWFVGDERRPVKFIYTP